MSNRLRERRARRHQQFADAYHCPPTCKIRAHHVPRPERLVDLLREYAEEPR
jgi:hypothetical protein